MPTLDWLNRAHAFTITAKVTYRLLEQVSKTTGQRFVMVEKSLNGMDMAAQIKAAANPR